MHHGRVRIWTRLALALILLATFAWSDGAALAADRGRDIVFTQTNEASGNHVVAFGWDNGTLKEIGRWATGGNGTGAGLGSQGAVVLSKNGRRLFVVNAGSDDVSVFAVTNRRLELIDKARSGGDMPISLTVHGNLLYVLNLNSDSISGFRVRSSGKLQPISDSTRPLSGSGVEPAQVQFSPNGKLLVVTERATNQIDTYIVRDDGLARGPEVQPSAGETPFGFAFRNNKHLIVSEAFGGAPDASATSSYRVTDEGKLKVISGSVKTTETAACWVVITRNGRYAYVTNTGSGSISGYAIHDDGRLKLLDADGRTGVTGDGSKPVDEALSRDSDVLYVLEAGTLEISAFAVHSDGSLAFISSIGGLPPGTTGLAAR